MKANTAELDSRHYLLTWTFVAEVFFCTILLFFCTTNVLVSFPLDKIMIFLLTGLIAILKPRQALFTHLEFSLIILLLLLAIISSLVNLVFFPMIFFPVVGLSFAFVISRDPKLLLFSLYYALIIHITLGIVFLILAYIGIENKFVYSLLGKGYNLFSARGFTATVQTYGTLCITWLILYLFRKKLGLNTGIDWLFFIINTLAIVLTLNRSTYLFWMIILGLKMRRLFWTIVIFLLALLINFGSVIVDFLTSVRSLIARSELLEGFNLSWVQSHSILIYVFGKGSDQLPPEIVEKVKWDYRSDIENGYAMILHTFGVIGLLFYISVCFYFLFKFVKIKKWAEAFILFYFFFIAQYFTQEFVSVSFYLFLAVMISIYRIYFSEVRPLNHNINYNVALS